MKSIGVSTLAFLALSSVALAHAMLEKAEPAAGAVLHGSPAVLRLEFSEPLEPAVSGITVADAAGRPVTSGAVAISDSEMTVALKPLSPGQYRVAWHAMSIDCHRTEGSYTFTVAP